MVETVETVEMVEMVEMVETVEMRLLDLTSQAIIILFCRLRFLI